MPARPRICVVGSSNIDLIAKVPRLPQMGETLMGHSFHQGFGGKGANQAVMAAKLGAQVSMVTKLGRDVFGENMLKNYREQGIDSEFVFFDEGQASGVAPIFVQDDGRNFIVVIPGANNALSPADVQTAAQRIRSADLLICQLEVPMETSLTALQIAHQVGVRTLLNPAPATVLPDEMFALSDICVPNETEAELLTGTSLKTLQDAEKAARLLLARGPQSVIITLGERGALLVDVQHATLIPALPVQALDSTGAGDAFVGSLAVFLGEGLSLEQAVRRANAIAALSVTRIGTQTSFPTRAEAEISRG